MFPGTTSCCAELCPEWSTPSTYQIQTILRFSNACESVSFYPQRGNGMWFMRRDNVVHTQARLRPKRAHHMAGGQLRRSVGPAFQQMRAARCSACLLGFWRIQTVTRPLQTTSTAQAAFSFSCCLASIPLRCTDTRRLMTGSSAPQHSAWTGPRTVCMHDSIPSRCYCMTMRSCYTTAV